jgi:hypothetical protein
MAFTFQIKSNCSGEGYVHYFRREQSVGIRVDRNIHRQKKIRCQFHIAQFRAVRIGRLFKREWNNGSLCALQNQEGLAHCMVEGFPHIKKNEAGCSALPFVYGKYHRAVRRENGGSKKKNLYKAPFHTSSCLF